MARGVRRDDETRAQVMAALLAGQGVQEVCAAYNVPERTIRKWRESILAEVCREKKERIAERMLDYTADLFTALRSQLRVASDHEYLRKQSAAEVATLHGVLADKGFRILDALARLEGDGDGQEADDGHSRR